MQSAGLWKTGVSISTPLINSLCRGLIRAIKGHKSSRKLRKQARRRARLAGAHRGPREHRLIRTLAALLRHGGGGSARGAPEPGTDLLWGSAFCLGFERRVCGGPDPFASYFCVHVVVQVCFGSHGFVSKCLCWSVCAVVRASFCPFVLRARHVA